MDEMNNQQVPNGYQQGGYPQGGYPPMTPEQRSARSMGIAGMVLGIVALVFCWLWFISLPCAIVGLILSIMAMKKGEKGMAVAGLVCSIIALAVAVIVTIIAIAAFSTVSHFMF